MNRHFNVARVKRTTLGLKIRAVQSQFDRPHSKGNLGNVAKPVLVSITPPAGSNDPGIDQP